MGKRRKCNCTRDFDEMVKYADGEPTESGLFFKIVVVPIVEILSLILKSLLFIVIVIIIPIRLILGLGAPNLSALVNRKKAKKNGKQRDHTGKEKP